MLLSDLILGKENEWSRLYDSTRTSPVASKSLYNEGLEQATHFVRDRFRGAGNVVDVAPWEGGIVGRFGDQTAVYRDPQGEVHAVSARCTHLGCMSRGTRRRVAGTAPATVRVSPSTPR
jgi:Rieske Fe-S protein